MTKILYVQNCLRAIFLRRFDGRFFIESSSRPSRPNQSPNLDASEVRYHPGFFPGSKLRVRQDTEGLNSNFHFQLFKWNFLVDTSHLYKCQKNEKTRFSYTPDLFYLNLSTLETIPFMFVHTQKNSVIGSNLTVHTW